MVHLSKQNLVSSNYHKLTDVQHYHSGAVIFQYRSLFLDYCVKYKLVLTSNSVALMPAAKIHRWNQTVTLTLSVKNFTVQLFEENYCDSSCRLRAINGFGKSDGT